MPTMPVDSAAPDPVAKAESPQRFSPLEELGNRGLHKNGGPRAEFLPGMRGRRAIETYQEMAANDPIVGSVMRAIEMVLRRVEWNVEVETDDPGDVERGEFLEGCMTDMSIPWADFVADALTMLPFGHAYLEIIYKKRQGPQQKDGSKRSDHNDGKIGWRKFSLIPQDTIVDWEYDETGGIQGACQATGYGAKVLIPIDKALLFRTSRRTPQGISVLRNAYLPWYYAKRIAEIEAIGIERDLAGYPVLYLDPEIMANPARYEEYRQIIRGIKRDEQEGTILPALYDNGEGGSGNPLVKLELLSSGGARQFDTGSVIARYARYIAMSLLQDVILLGHEKVGTQALASEKRDLSDVALSTWLNEIANVVNTHAVPRLLALNGMPLEAAPKIVPGDLRQEDAQKWSEALKNVAAAGIPIGGPDELEVLNFSRRRLGMPLVDQDVWEEAEAAKPVPPPPPPGQPMGPAPDDGTMPDGTEMPEGQ